MIKFKNEKRLLWEKENIQDSKKDTLSELLLNYSDKKNLEKMIQRKLDLLKKSLMDDFTKYLASIKV